MRTARKAVLLVTFLSLGSIDSGRPIVVRGEDGK